MAASSAWGNSTKLLEDLHRTAPPPVVHVQSLVTKVSQLNNDIKAGGDTYSLHMNYEPEKGKSTKLVLVSGKISEAHDGDNLIRYFCLPGKGPGDYPHVTVKYKTDGTLINLHYSMSRGASIWHDIGSTDMTGSSFFWGSSATVRNTAAGIFAAFLINALVTPSQTLYLTH